MKTLAKTTLSVASLSLALAFSAGAIADEKSNKHYGDEYFNGQYDERNSRYRDYSNNYRQQEYRH